MSSIVFHSVNSTAGIKQDHFDKTEFEKFIYFMDKYSFKGDFFSSTTELLQPILTFSAAQSQMLTYSQTIFSAVQRLWLGKYILSLNGK